MGEQEYGSRGGGRGEGVNEYGNDGRGGGRGEDEHEYFSYIVSGGDGGQELRESHRAFSSSSPITKEFSLPRGVED